MVAALGELFFMTNGHDLIRGLVGHFGVHIDLRGLLDDASGREDRGEGEQEGGEAGESDVVHGGFPR